MARFSFSVRSLMLCSLSLPGMEELLAQEAEEDGIDYRFTHYDEDPLPADKLAFGDPRRYEIDSHQFRIHRRLNDDYSLELGYQYETMSGSSPWYVVPGDEGPLQVMSGATISEKRHQADASVRLQRGDISHTGSVGFSTENDYQALYGSYAGEKRSADRLTTVGWGFSYSDDEVEPTDAAEFGRIPFGERDALSASASLARVLNRNAVIQSGVTLTRQTGYLSDPYKQVWINRAVLNDSRPDERHLFSWTTRFRQFFQRSKAALVLDYRFFDDDWNIRSHTFDAAWKQPLGENWELAPSLRYYTQSAADFYAPYYLEQPGDGFWSSDYRLSSFGSLSYRLNATYRAARWSASAGAEYYDSSGSRGLGSGQDSTQSSPGLVDFWRVTASFQVRL